MPVTYVNIEWPDKQKDRIYSPSSVIEEYFNIGDSLEINHFLTTCNKSLTDASERVRKKFGYACTSAQAESFRISEKCKTYGTSKKVKIISIN